MINNSPYIALFKSRDSLPSIDNLVEIIGVISTLSSKAHGGFSCHLLVIYRPMFQHPKNVKEQVV